MAQETRIVGGRNNTSAMVTDQQELLVRIGSIDSSGSGTGATEETQLQVLSQVGDIAGFTQDTSNYLIPASNPVTGFDLNRTIEGNEGEVSSSTGKLYGFFGYNSGPSQYLMFFNSVVNSDGNVPYIVIAVEANSNFSFDAGRWGLNFDTGISWSNSTTLATRTQGDPNITIFIQYK